MQACQSLKETCHRYLLGQLPAEFHADVQLAAGLPATDGASTTLTAQHSTDRWGIAPFFVNCRHMVAPLVQAFDFSAPTTARNCMRVLRALQVSICTPLDALPGINAQINHCHRWLQLRKPVLLEGSPGVGKTSLVSAIAKTTGRDFVRINLSDQTDMMDLLGADLPIENGSPGDFAW